ncbi:MAG: bifunctional diaminohydroxyphosphoribosylaminopyrimidine deaminase/5-amino-6-(5-phosphoribosylamino)uracil reductase RibD [Synergistaceae bacterium]|nr:bifunctional diaminohydroxyphosphoribosylaminopyrimidine deaminase/5-amino-6-(5-phosphoribosylamino)uracil reductase RibD [Synergistaceae bacterium]
MQAEFMKRALNLALNGRGGTSPNPMVGCVIVKDNKIIGEGWHRWCGNPHAEIEALNDAYSRGNDVKGATVYVTLEPCSHFGKTPPCANRLVKEEVAEVVIAMRDPNPKVNGHGIEILREAGIKVTELNEFESQAKELNRGFVFVHKFQRPFVTLKAALSLDGRLCLANGSSKWLTGIEARTKAHEIRAMNDAVLVGVGTVLADNPELTVRHVEGINPKRVVLDSNLRTPTDAKIISNDGKCLIFTTCNDKNKISKLQDAGAEVITLAELSVKNILDSLVAHGVLNLMVEGGASVLSSFLKSGMADYVNFFYAPKILGDGKNFNLNLNFNSVSEAFALRDIKTQTCGKDILIEGRLSCSPDL